jgi:predicted GTPase
MGTVVRAIQTLKDDSMERRLTMKQIALCLVICTTILALLLMGCTGIGQSKLITDPNVDL